AMPSFAREISALSPATQKVLTFAAHYHLLPESYLFGLADVQRVGLYMPTYIFGKIYAHGRWFYFPAILSLKWSVGVLGLLSLAAYAFARCRMQRSRDLWYIGGAALAYFALAIASPLNIGVRHVLPLFPLTFLLIGAGVSRLLSQRRMWLLPVACLLLWHVTDSLRMYPNYMPYANAFWGGASKTHLYFSDSATEWGQELKFTRQWTDAHHVTQCWFAYFPAPFLLPSDYGVPCKLLPTLDTMYEQDIAVPAVVHGPLLLSFADLNGFEFGSKVRNPYQQLFERTPDDVIADGVAVYYGDFELPRAAALEFIQRSHRLLSTQPRQAIEMAQTAVNLVPDGFDENLALGDALLAGGDKANALAAYRRAAMQLDAMEPSAKLKWMPVLQKKLSSAS
ncbi:MAG TPA: phospholipid carrier-dependent glycosyltransferase, partial [Acidobacteriaceae bacterium]|nr:phospholipid carrier-dependent glycosyltransferase [Acidobacteriaceae bacterium]